MLCIFRNDAQALALYSPGAWPTQRLKARLKLL